MRPTKHETFMEIAYVLSLRSTCPRRAVGCVLVDVHSHIIGTGYNGAPSGAPHCVDDPCPGYGGGHGLSLDLCSAIHAEQNALLQCRDVQKIAAVYTTSFPCIHCFKMLANTSCHQVFYRSDYLGHRDMVMDLNSRLATPMEFQHLATEPLHITASVDPASGFRTT